MIINFNKQFEDALRRFCKTEGILALLAIIDFIILFPGTAYFTEWNNWGLFKAIGILDMIIFGIWLILRRVPRFRKNRIGILFSFPCDEEDKLTKQELRRLYNKLENDIVERNLLSEFQIKKTPPNIILKDPEVRLRCLKKSKAYVVISGFAEEGTDGSENIVKIPKISFSYKDSHDSRGIRFAFVRSLFWAISGCNWQIRKNETLADRLCISENISDISLYIIGANLAYKAERRQSISLMDTAIEILERLLISRNRKKDKDQGKQIFNDEWLKTIRTLLYVAYSIKFRFLEFSIADRDDENKIKRGEDIIKRQKAINCDYPGAYLQNAILLFLRKDIFGSEQESKLAIRYSSGKDCAPYYSLAFLKFYQGRMKEGWSLLNKKAVPKSKDKLQWFNLNHIINFYHKALEADKLSQLYFPLGIIYKKVRGDIKSAKRYLKKFIEWAQKNKNWGASDKERKRFIKIAEDNLKICK